MPRTARSRPPRPLGHVSLGRQMSLLAWLHNMLGYRDTASLLADIKDIDEGFGSGGTSMICDHLVTRSSQFNGITQDNLKAYDRNIYQHLQKMNYGRSEPLTLRYFQYLAALYSEIYLERYHQNPGGLLAEINQYIIRHNNGSYSGKWYKSFLASDLKKIAFWMATGSGKTLLLHLNYYQFLHYNRLYGQPLDNILLITPNEDLSQQHLDELRLSNISAILFNLDEISSLFQMAGQVQITEITKLVEEKRGGGIRVPVEAFEGNNLIFVDEGHKGAGGNAWREMRDALAATGFTFEYSATFGQALAAADNEGLLIEYGKAIAFDYSYRHFYSDGYGKDFRIVNLQTPETTEDVDMLLLANLLSFYEQQLVFDKDKEALHLYKLERPLWTFVGGSVKAVYRRQGQKRSDVLTVVRFLHRVLSEPDWTEDGIRKLLGIKTLSPSDWLNNFSEQFVHIRSLEEEPTSIYRNILHVVMHTSSPGGLQLFTLRGNSEELGLKAVGSDDYFGVIYIGDVTEFRRLVNDDDVDIIVEQDAFTDSLFERINDVRDEFKTIQMLIGARKFIEGWNSWRVSNMGLLNIGRGEGSQIIQLFGRGVRLKGRGMSLKRSAVLDGLHPTNIRLLETLNIFAVRADYMKQFREYLESEGVPLEEKIERELTVVPNQEFLEQGLVVPRIPEGPEGQYQTAENTQVILSYDKNINRVSVSMSTRMHEMSSAEGNIAETAHTFGQELQIPSEIAGIIDWEVAYIALLEYKDDKGLSNLIIRQEDLKNIIIGRPLVYSLIAEETLVNPRTIYDWKRLQEATVNILCRYTDAFYRHHKRRWESNSMVYVELDKDDPNFHLNADDDEPGRYYIKIPSHQDILVQEIQQLMEDCNEMYRNNLGRLFIYFDRHLYQPLLVNRNERDDVDISPPGLNEGEYRFVADLKDIWEQERDKRLTDVDLFLLRNQNRGKGIGFFASSGFYPDFILWIKKNDHQRIVFVEPHGMRHSPAYRYDEKAKLHEELPELAQDLARRSPGFGHVQLDSYILSTTPYDDLYKHYDDGGWTRDMFTAKHILFPERNGSYDYLEYILQIDGFLSSEQQ